MRKLTLTLATALVLASAPAMAQSNGLFKPTAAPQATPAAKPAQPKSVAEAMAVSTAQDGGGSGVVAPPAGSSQVLPNDARTRQISLRNYETCKYSLNSVQGKLKGAVIRETANSLVITRRDSVATYVSSCSADGTLTTGVYTGGRVPPVTTPGGGTSTPGTRTPGVVTREK